MAIVSQSWSHIKKVNYRASNPLGQSSGQRSANGASHFGAAGAAMHLGLFGDGPGGFCTCVGRWHIATEFK